MQISVIEILKAILFGIVEGVTEWLPISSTGHMILLNEFVKLDVSPEFWNLFLVVIQLGAILAVVILYWKTIWPFKKVTTKSGGSKIIVRKPTIMLWLKALEEDAVAFCQKALKYDLIFVPADGFGAPGFFRVAYCIDTEQVERALPRIRTFVRAE